MVGFELVETTVVGFTAVLYPTQPVAWLQLFYLMVGSVVAVLGLRLWQSEINRAKLLVMTVDLLAIIRPLVANQQTCSPSA